MLDKTVNGIRDLKDGSRLPCSRTYRGGLRQRSG